MPLIDRRSIQNFDWVSLEDSLQWQAFLRLVALLEQRGNDLVIVMGPFNEHIMTRITRPSFASCGTRP